MQTTPNDAVQNTTISADHQTTHRGEVVRETPCAANHTPKQKRISIRSKRHAVLSALLDRGARGLNRFQAESICGDHVLPSTISELCGDFGMEIPRHLETVPGRGGRPTECARYRLSDADRAKARELLQLEPEALA